MSKYQPDGIARVNRLILEHLPIIDSQNKYTAFCRNDYKMNESNRCKKRTSVQRLIKNNIIGANIECFISKADISYSLSTELPTLKKVKKTGTTHDLVPILHPELLHNPESESFSNPNSWARLFFNNVVNNADLIHCISQHTRNQLIEHFNIEPRRTFVAYNGFKTLVDTQSILNEDDCDERPYFLTVSRLDPRKNIVRLIEAFNLAVRLPEFKDHKLIIIGKDGWGCDQIYNTIETLKLTERVITLGFVSDIELGYYYKNADFYICPSITEGFGLPIIEAMSFGTPIISSNGGALQEIAHTSTTFFNPYFVDSIYSSIIQAERRKKNISKSDLIAHAHSFSPQSMCQQIIKGITPLIDS